MINIITEIIRKNPGWLWDSKAGLSFMKMNTPSSGKNPNVGKVLIFVFETEQLVPTLCVKTVRTYLAGEVIRNNYNNLKLLESGVKGSSYSNLFAKPLYLHDDGEFIFCVETICPGVMFS